MSVTDEIKSRLDIVEVISDYMPLRKSGTSYSGFCPFHSNTRTPAFAVFPGSQTWQCFGACSTGGDVFSFVMKKEGWEFRDALAHLADRAGVTLSQPGPDDRERKDKEKRHIDLLTAAADFYHQLFLHAPQADYARNYIQKRGFDDKTVSKFVIGFALNSWESVRNHFTMQGYGEDELIDVGLLTVNEEKDSRYDRFRNRLMIPIRDVDGRVVGFGARTLDPQGLPKYLNSPQTMLFDKGRLLFGLDFAQRTVRQMNQIVIVEGYMDVLQAWQAGYRNVVAQMGTSLTGAQLKLAKKYSKKFVLALDADAAGVKATLRSLDVARESLDREEEVRFDARGLIRNEGYIKADIRVVTMPVGSDPDDVIRSNPEDWPKLVEAAKPVVAFVIDTFLQDLDHDDPKAKTEVLQQLMPLINEVANAAEREHYLQMLARKLNVSVRALYMLPGTPRSTRRRTVAAKKEDDGSNGERLKSGVEAVILGRLIATDVREANYLANCWRKPQIIQKVDRQLVNSGQPPVSNEDFERSEDRALLRHLYNHSARWSVVTPDELWDSLEDDVLRQRVQTLMDNPESQESEGDRLIYRLVLSILDWRSQKVKSLIKEVEGIIRETPAGDREELMDMHHQQLSELVRQLSAIGSARLANSAVGRRNTQIEAGERRPTVRKEGK